MYIVGVILLLFFVTKNVTCYKQDNINGTKRPHIILILADDLGWNDVSFHGSAQIPTPNIDALAYNGVILNRYYAQPLCTPSRSALLTGKYPIHIGMQQLVIMEAEPYGLPLKERLLPELLRAGGYRTHAIGKWHLGFFKKEYTPTFRGFDSHFGYWNGFHDYYDHTVHAKFATVTTKGYDMRSNMSVAWSSRGTYSTELFTTEAERLILNHDPATPMFMYLAHLAVHAGNEGDPFQAPEEEIAKFEHIADPERRVYAAMVSLLDQSVGRVMNALEKRGMLEDSIVLFCSDNGAPTVGIHSNSGSNYPLRGMKHSPWEGAVRSVAAIWSPKLRTPRSVSNELLHVTDWLPTLLAAAEIQNVPDNLDGINMWTALVDGAPSPRKELLHNIDDLAGHKYAAILDGQWKYIDGSTSESKYDGWYGESGTQNTSNYNATQVLTSETSTALNLYASKMKSVNYEPLTVSTIIKLRRKATLNCELPVNYLNMTAENSNVCFPIEAPCLFDVYADPCERVNLAAKRSDILQKLSQRLQVYRASMVKPNNMDWDDNANPDLHNNTWTTWQDICETDSYIMFESDNMLRRLVPASSTTLGIIAVIFLIVIMALLAMSVLQVSEKVIILSDNVTVETSDDELMTYAIDKVVNESQTNN